MNYDASQPGFELPAPLPGQGEGVTSSPEQPVSRPETSSPPPAVSPLQPQASSAPVPVASQPVSAIPSPAGQHAASTNPSVADDSDLIEKEWVDKAKQIVAATRDDPYTQNKELSRFKADYLKKRYNKDIKLEES